MTAENGDRPRFDPQDLAELERIKQRIIRHIEKLEQRLREALKTEERASGR